MKTLPGLGFWPPNQMLGAMAIGMFDGVHVGHRRVLQTLVESAHGLPACVMTFMPHPAEIVGLDPPPFLTSLEQKSEILESVGIDVLIVEQFTQQFASLSPYEFARELAQIGVPCVVVGEGFRYGRRGTGDVETLAEHGRMMGFSVRAVPPVSLGGKVVSSTLIRKLVMSGDLAAARQMMARAFAVRGRVLPGDSRGRLLGFPTANLKPPYGQCLPPFGVYAAQVRLEGRVLPAVLNLGSRPTFGSGPVLIEAHLIGYNGSMYGKNLDVEFLQFLRKERKFASGTELTEQVAHDKQEALRALHRMGFVYKG